MSNLRERCRAFLQDQKQRAMLREGSRVDDLVAFVIAERGRTADKRLDQSLPLCLYFATEADRQGFIDDVREAKPDIVMKKLP